jgi:hypothetical protein
LANFILKYFFLNTHWRDGRVAECGGLENRYPEGSGSWVRIPLSPPAFATAHPELVEGRLARPSFLKVLFQTFTSKNHFPFT